MGRLEHGLQALGHQPGAFLQDLGEIFRPQGELAELGKRRLLAFLGLGANGIGGFMRGRGADALKIKRWLLRHEGVRVI